MKSVIQTGILYVPAMDVDASRTIRSYLQQALPEVMVVLESYAGSQRNWVEDILRRWCDEEEMDLVLTVGATMPAPGPSSLEIVPEATADVLERRLPGFGESMRAYAQEQTELAMLDCSIAGIRGRTLIVNLPQGAAAALLYLEAISELIRPVNLYLQESPAAPWLSDELTIEAGEKDGAPAADSDKDAVGGSGRLNRDEFAAFLRRSAADRSSDDGNRDISSSTDE